eukprot:scaffold39224_cov31-Tisochrysis_lutea.AAC.5
MLRNIVAVLRSHCHVCTTNLVVGCDGERAATPPSPDLPVGTIEGAPLANLEQPLLKRPRPLREATSSGARDRCARHTTCVAPAVVAPVPLRRPRGRA